MMSDHDDSLKRWLRGEGGHSGPEPLRELEPLAAIPPGVKLSPELHEQIELEGALLAQLVGEHLASLPDSMLWTDPRFLEWVREENRASIDQRTDDDLFAVGERFHARVEARRLRVGGGQ